jgi:hypothetical protein
MLKLALNIQFVSTPMRTILIALLMTLATQVGAQEKFFCIDELSFGAQKQSSNWDIVDFEKQAFTIEISDDKKTVIGFYRDEIYYCKEPYYDIPILNCVDEFNEDKVSFNYVDRRYSYVHCGGFSYAWGGDDCGVQLGVCTPTN